MDKIPVHIENDLEHIMDYLTQSVAGVIVQDTEKETITYISDCGDKYTANCRMDSSRACVKDFCSQVISRFPL